ncbi:hypothetical protein CFE70_003201 [Pyrenophora teres f. teres 0-1]|uniref:DUF7730 domain-containing protein n=2 Tax=Pyrenophora teres f. teres TaxID=97479 RepID=E3RST2_PYRTT|nr:hypothetical protein PTT_12020 [Pyrenophora teres f. teres 0-1]KAE8846326.1 hypothetical protein HRS9139_00893 [Pyrenophora teres f. teres]KAE8848466.1 hypothetical protein PTNB85_02309 [Pyrenophora teres f. teres]KAE8853368.1 hypothetical protein HRS9122_00360 [Pyrenophora teres f. teres]KAE8868391.1 hypothetical protein PTNB29_02302 [Pyrenophora teres f. teres]
MSNATATAETFASGRYSKRKRTQITYQMDELDVSDEESDFESLQVKKKRKTKSTSSPDKPLPKHKIFPFMLLPAEIRNIIYDYTLADPLGINLVATIHNRRRQAQRIPASLQKNISRGLYYKITSSTDTDTVAQDDEPAPLVPALLTVCKQIHSEGKDVLYGNDFVFADSLALYAFMINLGASGAKHIKKITLRGWLDGRATKCYNHCCFAALVSATNLTSFVIETPSSYHRSPQPLAHQLYRDAFPWLEAVGAAKGKVDAGLDVVQLGDDFFRRSWGHHPYTGRKEEQVEEFKSELGKLLGAQQLRVMGTAPRREMKDAEIVEVDD